MRWRTSFSAASTSERKMCTYQPSLAINSAKSARIAEKSGWRLMKFTGEGQRASNGSERTLRTDHENEVELQDPGLRVVEALIFEAHDELRFGEAREQRLHALLRLEADLRARVVLVEQAAREVEAQRR